MNAATRAEIVSRLQKAENGMIATKGREYTKGADLDNDGDTLSNFKRVAERVGISPMQAWLVFFTKHMDAIETFIADPSRESEMSEPIFGRILDARTYLGLLQCLVEEGRPEPEGPVCRCETREDQAKCMYWKESCGLLPGVDPRVVAGHHLVDPDILNPTSVGSPDEAQTESPQSTCPDNDPRLDGRLERSSAADIRRNIH